MPEPRQTRWGPGRKTETTKEIIEAESRILNAVSVEPLNVSGHDLSDEKYKLQKRAFEVAQGGLDLLDKVIKAASATDLDERVLAPTNAEAIQAVKAAISAADISRGDITLENQDAMNLVLTLVFEEVGDLIPQDRADKLRNRIQKAILNYDTTQRRG